MFRRAILACALALCAASALADDAAQVVADLSQKAMARGYGATCSLEMQPVARGGYYRCLDFGPYRVVQEYGRLSGFVVMDGKPPFRIMSYGERGTGFVDGPWVIDMPARLVTYWAEVVEGGAERARKAGEAKSERRAAEEYIRKLNEPPADPKASSAKDGQQPDNVPPRGEAPPALPVSSDAGGGILEAITKAAGPAGR